MEEAIEEEAAEQARQVERTRNNLNALMAAGHLRAMEYLEELDPASMRFADVAQVIRLHLDAVEKLDSGDESGREDVWREADDEMLDRVVDEIEAEEYQENEEENSGEEPEEDWEA